jgi:hypothetical protein
MLNRAVVGLGLVALGTLFLLDEIGALDAGDTLGRWWPLILVVLGLAQVVANPRHLFGPGILVLLGGVLLVSTLDLTDVNVWEVFWPLVLVLVGLRVAVGADGSRRESAGRRASAFALFSGRRVDVTSAGFKRGSITSLFGGATLDLRRARLAEGGGAVDVFVAFGSAEIVVPTDWPVRTSGLPIFGGWSGPPAAEGPPSDAPELSVYLVVLFGGAAIKRRPAG